MDKVLTALREKDAGLVQAGTEWKCRCPAHADDKPSLSVSAAPDGKVLIHCHAGCSTKSVVDALGLKMGDLFPEASSTEDIVYQYQDDAGVVQFEKLRRHPKKFLQRRPVPGHDGEYVFSLKAGWIRKEGGTWKVVSNATNPKTSPGADCIWVDEPPHLLYRQPEIREAVKGGRIIYLPEGEKDADNLVSVGLDATTNSEGAGKPWREEYGEVLRGADVVFIPDQDDPGRKHFDKWAPEIAAVAKKLRRIDLPAGFKDVSDWLAAGHTREEFEALVAAATPLAAGGPTAEILDEAPETIRRPLCRVGGQAYLATWVSVGTGEDDSDVQVLVRDDGKLFSERAITGASPLAELGVNVNLPTVPEPSQILSGAGVKAYISGTRPNPVEVFGRVRRVVDAFMDFGNSLGPQDDMVDLTSLYIFGTYYLDAFNVIGYLWPNGDKGVGKTKFISVVANLGYLGQVILAGGSFASLRDLADYGAVLGFDDAEKVMDQRKGDPDKQALLLAGNKRGTFITLKEPVKDGWKTRRVNAFCPRLFSAISLPDDVLSSRSIIVPLVRSSDGGKANRDPSDFEIWPEDRRKVIDALWMVGLEHLVEMRSFDRAVVQRTPLIGRTLEPWRAILAVALWLEEKHGMVGLFDRMNKLAINYQEERQEVEDASHVVILIKALGRMMEARKTTDLEFSPRDLAAEMGRVATEDELDFAGDTFATAKGVGRLLKRLRLHRALRTAKGKRWHVTVSDLDGLRLAYGLTMGIVENAVCAVSAVDAVLQETPAKHKNNGTVGLEPCPTPSGKPDSAVSANSAVSFEIPNLIIRERSTDDTRDTVGNTLDWNKQEVA